MSRTSAIVPRMRLASRLIVMRQQPMVGRCQSLRSAFAIAHQRRTYSVSLATDPSEATIDDVDDATMARHNLLSRRLYRTLLRSCQHGVHNANKSNSISGMTSLGRSGGEDAWMLLQPPMDQRQYGHAKILLARRGRGKSLPNSEAMHNQAAGKMSREEVGMAMEVLRFVHMSLGGDADDNLEDYYLGRAEDVEWSLDDMLGMNDGKKDVVHVVEEAITTAAAGRHSEGHYTDFIDEDEERGEGEVAGTTTKGKEEEVIGKEIEIPDEWDSDDDEAMYPELDVDESVLVSSADLANAVRIAFRAPLVPATQANEGTVPLSTIIAGRHRDAIGACSMLAEQLRTWGGRSSIAVDAERGVRVAVTSALMKRPDSVSGNYRFCYRVRVENVCDAFDEKTAEILGGGESAEGKGADAKVERRAVQLLGRTWNIFERGPWHKTSSSVLKRLLEEGVILPESVNSTEEEDKEKNELRMVQTVDEPRTGAVGHLPVLGPGEVFEYMSGAEIATKTGAMGGAFHLASVDMQSTHSALVGNKVEALTWNPNDERRFQMPVNVFGFEADDTPS
ncbi:hypothetical protein ACHAXT_005212 [Thalassiosira profunda]